ncbi:MAG TPA: M1 family aminopeptidase [Bryobacteraceae bacterium]|nr:M1 family aminopeptidase [Bryobacteraceae bacterium]
MLLQILRFETRYWLRGFMVWVFFVIIGTLFLAAASSDHVHVGGVLENTNRNAPYVIQSFYFVASIFMLLMTTAFVNAAAARDFAYNTWQMVFSTPLKRSDFLLGRFFGATIVSVIPILGVSAGILLARYMPWADADRFGPVLWSAHLKSLLVFGIPNTLLVAAIIFAIASLTRSTITSFIAALILLVGFTVSDVFLSDIRNETIAAITDPFGGRAFDIMTKYWTVSDRNKLSLGWEGLLLWNRLLWMTVSGAIFAFAYHRFSFSERNRKAKRLDRDETKAAAIAVVLPAIRPSRGVSAALRQFAGSVGTEFFGVVKSTSFIVILLASMLNMIPALIFSAGEGYGNQSLPVTYWVCEMIAGTLYLFLIGMVTYYAGVLVWKERDARMDEICDAMPSPGWTMFASKFAALLGIILMILLVAILCGIVTQASHGYTRFQLGLYVKAILVVDVSLFLFLSILAFFIHVFSANKYVGYFAYVAFLIVNAFIWIPLDASSLLLRYGARPNMTYSDFFHFAPFIGSWNWFTVYWLAFSTLIAIATVLFWPRGKETSLGHRGRVARQQFGGVWRVVTLIAFVVFFASGAWAFYNTKILNEIVTPKVARRRQADYEKTYKKYEGIAQPRVQDVRYAIDLFPGTRNIVMHGDQVIQNKTAQPIAEIHVVVDPDYDSEIQLDGATLASDDKRLYYRIYKLAQPMAPGESRPMKFTVRSHVHGIENEVSHLELVENGTFFNSFIAPQIGYQPRGELTDKNDRKKEGLKEKDLMPALERNCDEHCRNTYLSNNSDWVNVDTVISTSPDQIAVAPGSLEKDWTENGRRYFHYQLDHFSLNFYSFISARYEVAREEWNGVKIEVYYDKEHVWNVPKMLKSIRKSLEYYTTNFGPYAHKEARIIEFPRVARFAQAFPGTMPYSESVGFIANLSKADDIDMVYYVVAHEMGHQWWAHQVVGANMQGATLLSETMAQYSALMVMEHEYGRDTMRKFLEYEMDNYLKNRGRETLKERPLLTVESQQGYVHYRKGSVVMYYLKERIGEEAVNRALRKMIAKFAYRQPPYPTSHDLVDAFNEETPEQFRYLIKDLFDDITLFSNRTLSAKSEKLPDGKYRVTIDVESKKFKADDQGNETEVPVNDWIEIGALAKAGKNRRYGNVLYRQLVKITGGKQTFQFELAEKPYEAGIDPMQMLIDRVPSDNLKKVD